MPTASPGGRRYQVCVIDDHSKHKAILPTHTKGQATDAVMALVNRWENELGIKTNTIRSDGGKEYTGSAWSAWLAAKGIRHETTTRYTPQQNGVAERYNRTITELVGALMTDAALKPKWWADAAVAINYVGNRTPHRGESITPYEALHGIRPDVSNLRALGCRAWVYMPHEIRRKMDPRAVEGVFIGYADTKKAYKVIVDDKVIASRDVKFDEATVG
eukprot:contig_5092_g1127